MDDFAVNNIHFQFKIRENQDQMCLHVEFLIISLFCVAILYIQWIWGMVHKKYICIKIYLT